MHPFLFLIGLHGKGDRDFMIREVQNPTMLAQIFWKDAKTGEVVSILEEVTFSDRASLASFIEKRLRFYASISSCKDRLSVVPSYRVYYLVRSTFKTDYKG